MESVDNVEAPILDADPDHPIPPSWARLNLSSEAVAHKEATLETYRRKVASIASSSTPHKPDMQAYKLLKGAAGDVYGHVAGVAVGEAFNNRGELAILGLHRRILQGIDGRCVKTLKAGLMAAQMAHAQGSWHHVTCSRTPAPTAVPAPQGRPPSAFRGDTRTTRTTGRPRSGTRGRAATAAATRQVLPPTPVKVGVVV